MLNYISIASKGAASHCISLHCNSIFVLYITLQWAVLNDESSKSLDPTTHLGGPSPCVHLSCSSVCVSLSLSVSLSLCVCVCVYLSVCLSNRCISPCSLPHMDRSPRCSYLQGRFYAALKSVESDHVTTALLP